MFSLRINTLSYITIIDEFVLTLPNSRQYKLPYGRALTTMENWPSKSIQILLTLGCILGILQQIFPLIDQFFELPLEDGILPKTDEGLKQSPSLKSHVGPHMHTWLLYWTYHYLPGIHPPESNEKTKHRT